MVEVLGAGLALHKLMVILGQMVFNRLDEAGRVVRLLSARGRTPSKGTVRSRWHRNVLLAWPRNLREGVGVAGALRARDGSRSGGNSVGARTRR